MKPIHSRAIVDIITARSFGPVMSNLARPLYVEAMTALILGDRWRYLGEWDGWDFERDDGIRLEVKQSAVRQSWSLDDEAAVRLRLNSGVVRVFHGRLRDEARIPILYVSHSASEVARLATSVVALDGGRVVAQGSAVEVLGNPAILPAGVREAGAVLIAHVTKHHLDGLTELDAGGISLFLPWVQRAPGTALRVRIAAHDVIVSRNRPEGLSALNILPGVVHEVRSGEGPGAIVALDTKAGRVLARITRRSAEELGLVPAAVAYAIVKTVSIAPTDVGTGSD